MVTIPMPDFPNDKDAYVIAENLNRVYEQDYTDSLFPEELVSRTGFDLQRVSRAIAGLLAKRWIEKTRESTAGYAVAFTPFGKEEFDKQSGVIKNEGVRRRLLAELARKEEEKPGVETDSLDLALKLNISNNTTMFNLKILQYGELVETRDYCGAGEPACQARITPKGKSLYDDPAKLVVFISHAVADKEIAISLSKHIKAAFPEVMTFVSSAPDSIAAGDPWFDTILQYLRVAEVGIVIATERSMDRPWVWLEIGAMRYKGIFLIPCRVGNCDTSKLPLPIASLQIINLCDEHSVSSLFAKVEEYSKILCEPDYHNVAEEMSRLNKESEMAFHRATEPYSAEQRLAIQRRYEDLDPIYKEIIRIMMFNGEVTDAYVLSELRKKDLLPNFVPNLLPGMLKTGLIQEVLGPQNGQRRFRVNPKLEPLLREILSSNP